MKKTMLAVSLFLGSASIAAGAAPSVYPGEVQRSGWSIDPSVASVYISTKDVVTPRWFILNETGSNPKSSVQLLVDGVDSNYPVNLDGGALVFGKSIVAKTYSGTDGQYGFWSIIDPLKVGLPDVLWSIHPDVNQEAFAGLFDMKREFLFSFSPDSTKGDCANGKLKLIVDGQIVKDPSGKDWILFQGGSVIAKGQHVRFNISGTCKPGKSFSGSLKLL